MLSQQYGKIAVEMAVERHSGTYTYRDFNLTNVEVIVCVCVCVMVDTLFLVHINTTCSNEPMQEKIELFLVTMPLILDVCL